MAVAGRAFSWRSTLLTNTAGSLVLPVILFWLNPELPWPELGRATLFSAGYANSIGTLAALMFTAAQPVLARVGTPKAWLLVLLILVVCAATGCALGTAFIVLTGLVPQLTFMALFTDAFRYCLPICLVIGLVAGVVERTKSRLRTTELEMRTGQLQRERAEKLAAEARLSSLESRIHPHFLFNALNSISSLIREDPERAERLIEHMASLLRFSLDSDATGLVPLSRELKIVHDYLEIEKARFGERLRFEIAADEDTDSFEVPRMSVQTLVENSVKFAVSPRREGGMIRVTASASGTRLTVRVHDNGGGFSPDTIPKGHGLDLLQSRLEAAFGPSALLNVSVDASGTTVEIKV